MIWQISAHEAVVNGHEHLVPTELRTFIPDDNFTSPPSASSNQKDDVWMELLDRKSDSLNLYRHHTSPGGGAFMVKIMTTR